MPPVTTNTDTTTSFPSYRVWSDTGKVYRVVSLGQLCGCLATIFAVAFPIGNHDASIFAFPVLYASNGPMVRQDSETQRPPTNKSKTFNGGKDSWRQSLQMKLSVQWRQVDLKQIVMQSDWPGVTLWCDRRVDTSQVVDLEIQSQPLRQVVQTLADRCQVGLAMHSGVVALVPKNHAESLPVVLADVRRQAQQLPPAWGRIWLERQERRWPPLSQPSQIVSQWLQPLPRTWAVAPLPHDVWDAGKLPEMALIEQVTFVAFGFGLRPVLAATDAGPSLTFEALTPATICTIVIDDTFQRTELRKLKGEFAQRYPALTGRFDNDPQVSGPLHELGVLMATLESKRPQPGVPTGESRYTIKLDGQPAETVIRFLAQQVKREVSFEPGLPEAQLTKLIQLDADQWTLEELFRQIGQQAQLDIQIDASRILVRQSTSGK